MPSPFQTVGSRNNEVLVPPSSAGALDSLHLTPGTVLDVRVVEKASGERGLAIRGQFVPAILPPNAHQGDALTVQVVANQEAVVLKILTFTTTTTPNNSQLLDTFLTTLLRPDERTAVGDPTNFQAQTVPTNLENLFKQLDDETPSSPQRERILETLRQLLNNGLVIDEAALRSPETLETALRRWAQQSSALHGVGQQVRAASDAILDLVSALSKSRLEGQVAAALEGELASLLQSKSDLSTEPPPPSATPKPAATPAADDAFAPDAPIAAAKAAPSALRLVSPSHHFLLMAQIIEQELNSPAAASSETPQDLCTQLFQCSSELRSLSTTPQKDGAIRTQLQAMLQRVKTARAAHIENGRGGQNVIDGENAIKTLGSMASANEVLTALAPIVRSLGEPGVALVPLMVPPLVSPLVLSIGHHHAPEYQRVDPDETKQSAVPPPPELETISFTLNLPTLGPVAVSFGHHAPTLLGAISCASETARDKIQARMSELVKRMNQLGFSEAQLATRVTEPTETPVTVLPPWLKELQRRHTIA